MLAEMLSVGTTEDVMVTETLLGLPTLYAALEVNVTVRTRSGSTTLFVTVGIATCIDDWSAGTTMLPPGTVKSVPGDALPLYAKPTVRGVLTASLRLTVTS